MCLACLVCVVCLVCMLRLLCLARLACLDSLLCLLCLAWVRTCVRTYARMPVAISSMGSRLRGIRPPAQHMEASSPVTSGGTSGVPRARGAPAQTCSTLEKIPRLLPWTNILTWENGSYRSADMVEALDRMLPDAKDSSESIVVMLDGYPGHLPDEVRELVHSKGHVLLFHGRGCTPYAQMMDTNLHATLAGGQAGSVRIPLDKLGVWPQNRGTSSCSGLHVHEAAAGDPTAVPERP